MSCARCEDLQEQVAFLKSELGIREDAEGLDRLRKPIGVAPGVAALILRLYDGGGKLVTYDQLHEAIPAVLTNQEDRNFRIVQVYCTRARQALGRDAIATVWGIGYRLTDVGRATVAGLVGGSR